MKISLWKCFGFVVLDYIVAANLVFLSVPIRISKLAGILWKTAPPAFLQTYGTVFFFCIILYF